VNDGRDLPLPPADFGNLRMSDHSAIWQRRRELGCPLPFLYPPPVGPPVFLAVTVADGAVVAHPKIAEVRVREGEIPNVIHQLRLVLL